MKNQKSIIFVGIIFLIFLGCVSQSTQTVKSTMDNIVTRLYANLSDHELESITHDYIMNNLSDKEKDILSKKYWYFDVNVPVIVSVMQHQDQQQPPFWLEPSGFSKTNMIVKNEEYTYSVWQKEFNAGRVELGINGFDKHRPVYFVSIGPKNKADKLELSNFYPTNQHIEIMQLGAFTYHDWDELVLTQVPESLIGNQLLTTIRGRAREAHLINAFRNTPFPSSENPDQISLTWSDDPSTTMNIQWRTNSKINQGQVHYWTNNQDVKTTDAEEMLIENRLLKNDRYTHRFHAKLVELEPNTTYKYTVGYDQTWSDTSEFVTGPQDSKPFSFVYFGDTHRSPHWGQLINAAFKQHPATSFFTIGGDVVSTGLYRDDWDHWFEYGQDVLKQRPMMTTLGNHDNQDGLGAQLYLDLFEYPKNGPDFLEKERVYSFEYSNALFIMLDATAPIKDQTKWLENTLANSDKTWKFAFFHFPPYSYEEDYPVIRKQWGDLFDKYHVDMVFSGHVHYYMRSKPMYNQKPVKSPADGTIYVISISVPNGDREMPSRDFVDVRFGGEPLYLTIDINKNTLEYKTYNLAGDIKDEFKIEK